MKVTYGVVNGKPVDIFKNPITDSGTKKSAKGLLRVEYNNGEYITEDNPIRVIDAFVDQLALSELGFAGIDPAQTGRPSYHPAAMLKLYIP